MKNIVTQSDLKHIYDSAKQYEDSLLDRCVVLFYETKQGNIEQITIEFNSENFCHLVGIAREFGGPTAKELFTKALHEALNPKTDFHFSSQKTRGRLDFDLKKEVVAQVFSLKEHPLQLGEFNDHLFVNLDAEKVIGHNRACLALDLGNVNYFPKSTLNKDFRECIYGDTDCPVLCTAWYKKNDLSDITISFISKSIDKVRSAKLRIALKDLHPLDEYSVETRRPLTDKLFNETYVVHINYGITPDGEIFCEDALDTRDIDKAKESFEECKKELIDGYFTFDGHISHSFAYCEITAFKGDVITHMEKYPEQSLGEIQTFNFEDYEKEYDEKNDISPSPGLDELHENVASSQERGPDREHSHTVRGKGHDAASRASIRNANLSGGPNPHGMKP